MIEKELIEIIKNTINSEYIGDDCAYFKRLGIVVTQDNLVEDIHFSLKYTTGFELGYKSAMVNLSDIAASGGRAECLSVGLSLPNYIDEGFVKSFYEGMKFASENVEIIGGDITGADKVMVSVCAIGSDKNRKISSRKCAKVGQKICVSGVHGSSALGLKLLSEGNYDKNNKFIKSHLMPQAKLNISKQIAENINYDYAMMDTSDGLADALFTIAELSKVKLAVDFSKIPYEKELENFDNWKDLILYGGEDYELVATLNDNIPDGMTIIGEVKEGCGVEIFDKDKIFNLKKNDLLAKTFNHF